MRKLITIALAATISATALGQSKTPIVKAVIQPDSIAIGDLFTIKVEVSKDQMQLVDFPVFENHKMGDRIEVMGESQIDTIARDGRSLTLSKTYTLTTFDEGDYDLGKFPLLYIDKNITDTIWSEDPVFLKVGTFEIDTLTQNIYDIKRPAEAPLKIGEFSGYLLWAILGFAVIGVLVWLLIRYRKDIPIMGSIIKSKPKEPAHVVAIRALEALHNQKLWQNGKFKTYYTGLTDIIRKYITARYGIHAMEMTSDEILDAIKEVDLSAKNMDFLRSLLKSADLVKFAKYIPDAEENEQAYNSAYYFVEETKLIDTNSPQADNKGKTI